MKHRNESLIKTIFRSFFKGFFSIFGFLFGLIAVGTLISIMITKNEFTIAKTSIEILPDLNGNTKLLPLNTPAILQIDIDGIIGLQVTKKNIDDILINSRKDFLKNNRVKAVLLKLNTPGGAVYDSDAIYKALKRYKEKFNVPIYAYVDGMSASGGMYIMSAADSIYSSDSSLVGSVGVIVGSYFNITETLEKIGVKTKTVSDGKNKMPFNPLEKWEENEGQNLIDIGKYYYNQFVDIVTENRPLLTKEKLVNVYGANAYPAPLAQKYGYIDYGKSSYEKALIALIKKANIDIEKPYQIIKLKPKKKIFNEIFENTSIFKGKIKHEIELDKSNQSKLKEKIAYLFEM